MTGSVIDKDPVNQEHRVTANSGVAENTVNAGVRCDVIRRGGRTKTGRNGAGRNGAGRGGAGRGGRAERGRGNCQCTDQVRAAVALAACESLKGNTDPARGAAGQ